MVLQKHHLKVDPRKDVILRKEHHFLPGGVLYSFCWNWNIEICIHSPYRKDVWLLAAHNFAYCCRCWAWRVPTPQLLQLDHPMYCYMKKPTVWLYDLSMEHHVTGGGQWRQRKCNDSKNRQKGCDRWRYFEWVDVLNYWLMMINAVTHFSILRTLQKIHLGYFQRSFLIPRIVSPLPQSLLSLLRLDI